MAKEYEIGAKVQWHWGPAKKEGIIKEKFYERTVRRIDGEDIVKHGTKENPAYLIEINNGAGALLLHSEIEKEGYRRYYT